MGPIWGRFGFDFQRILDKFWTYKLDSELTTVLDLDSRIAEAGFAKRKQFHFEDSGRQEQTAVFPVDPP